MTGRDSAYYDGQAEQELRLAAHASSEEQRKIHLNQAAEFSTMAERAMGDRDGLVQRDEVCGHNFSEVLNDQRP